MRKMRLYLTLLLILSYLPFVKAQLLPREDLNWGEVEVTLTTKVRDSIFNKIDWSMPENMPDTYVHKLATFKKSKYHFLHLNSDNKLDALYYGEGLVEGNMTVVFINNSEALVKSESRGGKLLKIEQEQPNSIISLTIDHVGCCAEPANRIFQLMINPVTGEISESSKNAYIKDTQFPKTRGINTRFEVLNSRYHLRISPEIVNEGYVSEHLEQGNIVGTYQSGDKGTALAEFTDSTGRVWWFVLMDAKDELIYHRNNLSGDCNWYGWMSSRFVKSLY